MARRVVRVNDRCDPNETGVASLVLVAMSGVLTWLLVARRVDHNQRWLEVTRPMVEAFVHARFMVEMAVRYGDELDEPPDLLPSGWAALLCLYGIR